MESGRIVISRAARTAEFPARFQLLASLNPCPCGYFGDPDRPCQCSPGQIQNYRNRISGPLLDRIDLQVEVPRIPHQVLRRKNPGSACSEQIKQQVVHCRQIQRQRNHGKSNAHLNGEEIDRLIPLNDDLLDFLSQVVDRLRLSARAYHRIIKVSRTIADLAGCDEVRQNHLAEAISFRGFDRTQ